MKVLYHTQGDGQSYHRVHMPAKHITEPLKEKGIELVVADTFTDISEYDAYIIQRLPAPEFMPVLEEIIRVGKKFIWSTDDNVWQIPKNNPAYELATPEAIKRMTWCVNNAHSIISSTPYLSSVIEKVASDTLSIFTLPNLLDLNDWTEPRAEHDKLRIIFAGSAYHNDDLNMIAYTLEKIMKQHNVLMIFFGDAPDSMIYWKRIKGDVIAQMMPLEKWNGKMGIVRPVHITHYPATLRAISPDIAIAPLTHEPFNASKSNLKYLEYTLAGAATIAQNLAPYKDAKALLPTNKNQWEEQLNSLIIDADRRKKLQAEAFKDVTENFTWQNNKDIWVNAFCAMLG